MKSSTYHFLLHAHSITRYAMLALLVAGLLNAYFQIRKKSSYKKRDDILNRSVLGISHLQFLFGIILYTHSPNTSLSASLFEKKIIRHFSLEHTLIMFAGIILITLAVMIRKKNTDVSKHITVLKFQSAGALLIAIGLLWLHFASGS